MSNTTTLICGYYNGARWPIQLVISKLNITMTLEPGKYILDREGRKINDPYFEVFANNKQLHRELGTTPVPIIAIPPVTSAVTPVQNSSPVHAVTEWKQDNRGVRQPVLHQPTGGTALPAAVVASASDAVKPMSIEEARRLGLVRKVREVPEDYGVNDTTGLPPSGIPKMRYSIDPGVNRQAPALPKEMLALPKDDPSNPTRAQLVAGLAGSAAPSPEDAAANPFSNTAVVNAPFNSPIRAGTPGESLASPVPDLEVEPAVEPELEPELEPALPEPALESLPKATSPQPLRPLTPNNKFICIACSAPHKFRSQLIKHAQQKHPERLRAIMAPYPEAPSS